jgi:serine/threonine protein kinase
VKTTPIWVKLADFGISKLMQEDETELRTRIGTEGYMAPEVFGLLDDSRESSSYTSAVDVWSLGCLLYYALTKRLAFSTFLSLQAYAKGDAAFPEKPLYEKCISLSGRAFIQRLLSRSPEARPKASKRLLASWIIDTNAIPDPPSALDPEDPVGRPSLQPPSHKNSSSESGRGPTPSPLPPSGPEMVCLYRAWLTDKYIVDNIDTGLFFF